MDKYSFRIPYDYIKYGTLKGFVYADSESEALQKLYDSNNRLEEDYDDSSDSGDTNYDYSEAEVELEEEDVLMGQTIVEKESLPSYFLAELYLL